MIMVFDNVTDFVSAVSNVQVEDFEGIPWDPPGFKPNPLIDTETGLIWSAANNFFVTNQVANSTALSIGDFDDFFAPDDLADLMSVILPNGVTAVGIFVSSLGQNHGINIQAFDAAGGLLLDAISEPTGAEEFDFIGIVSMFNIRRVDFVSTEGPPNDDFALDDFHYGVWNFGQNATSTAVSEPVTLALFGGALALFGVAARRRGK